MEVDLEIVSMDWMTGIDHAPGNCFDGRFYYIIQELPLPVSITKFDRKSEHLVDSFPFSPNAGSPAGIEFDGKDLLVCMNNDPGQGQGRIYRVDPKTGAIRRIVATFNTPTGGDTDGKFLWVSDIGDGKTYKLNLRSGVTLRTLTNPGASSEDSFIHGRRLVIEDRDLELWSYVDWRTGAELYRRMKLNVLGSRAHSFNGHDFLRTLSPLGAKTRLDPLWTGDYGILDRFVGANGTHLTAHSPDLSAGSGWQTAGIYGVEWEITGNRADPTAGTDSDNPILIDSLIKDGHIDVRSEYGGDIIGLYFRYIDANNKGMVFYEGTNLVLAQVVGGVYTQLDSRAIGWAVGQIKTLFIDFRGDFLAAGLDNQELAGTVAFPAALKAATIHGPFVKNVGGDDSRFSAFRVRK
jgi:hypothetical protein